MTGKSSPLLYIILFSSRAQARVRLCEKSHNLDARRTPSDTTGTAAELHARSTGAAHGGEDDRADPSGETEPQEGADGLGFVAALVWVARADSNNVAVDVIGITTAVGSEVRGQCDSATEEEEHVEDIEG